MRLEQMLDWPGLHTSCSIGQMGTAVGVSFTPDFVMTVHGKATSFLPSHYSTGIDRCATDSSQVPSQLQCFPCEADLAWPFAIPNVKSEKAVNLGYALAANSCERANSVESCTVTALWCDHCFRSSKPQRPFAKPFVFSGLAIPASRPAETDHPAYFGLATIRKPTLSACKNGAEQDYCRVLVHVIANARKIK
jgi:hypothetical protein